MTRPTDEQLGELIRSSLRRRADRVTVADRDFDPRSAKHGMGLPPAAADPTRSGHRIAVAAVCFVALAVAGIAAVSAANDHSTKKHRVTVTEPAASTERTTAAPPTSRPPVRSHDRTGAQTACSQADLGNSGTAPMPTPSRVSARRVINQVTLDPPAATDHPTISAAQAWANPLIAKPVVGTYELVLTRLSAPLPARPGADGRLVPEYQNVLVWVVIADHVPAVPIGPGPPRPGATTIPRPPCFFEDAMTWIDARTGQLLISSTFPAASQPKS